MLVDDLEGDAHAEVDAGVDVRGGRTSCLVAILGIPDGIWGTGLDRLLIGLAVLVAVSSTLALIITVRTGSLMVTASLAVGCSSTSSSSQRPATPTPRPVSCHQQYQAWERGPAVAEDKMQTAVNTVQAAEQSGNVTALRPALKKLVPAALAAAPARRAARTRTACSATTLPQSTWPAITHARHEGSAAC